MFGQITNISFKLFHSNELKMINLNFAYFLLCNIIRCCLKIAFMSWREKPLYNHYKWNISRKKNYKFHAYKYFRNFVLGYILNFPSYERPTRKYYSVKFGETCLKKYLNKGNLNQSWFENNYVLEIGNGQIVKSI